MASLEELLTSFGGAVEVGNAAVFVGSGLSRQASTEFPDWKALVAPLRGEADIPRSLTDLPLIAEYFEQAVGRTRLVALLADAVGRVRAGPALGHRLLAELGVAEVWTTNYDRLLEQAMPAATVVVRDADLANRLSARDTRLVKMHGSLSASRAWEAEPVITRGDYERYEVDHPRLWAALRAAFLTRSFLFLGFGFADPNVEVFLRLARSLGQQGVEHFAVLQRPRNSADTASARTSKIRGLLKGFECP